MKGSQGAPCSPVGGLKQLLASRGLHSSALLSHPAEAAAGLESFLGSRSREPGESNLLSDGGGVPEQGGEEAGAPGCMYRGCWGPPRWGTSLEYCVQILEV